MAGIIKGKDIIDGSIVDSKLESTFTKFEDLPQTYQFPADAAQVVRTETDVQINSKKAILIDNQYVEEAESIIVPSADPTHAGAYPASHYSIVDQLPILLANRAEIKSVYGSITTTGDILQLPIGDTGLILQLQYRDAGIANLYATTSGDSVVASIRRASIYGDTSQGSTFDNFTFTNTIQSSQLIDDVLNNSNDWVTLYIRVNNQLYNAFIWISSTGQESDMWYIKIR